MPILVVLILALIGTGQIVSGVYILAGLGWALIALGLSTILAAVIVSRGIANG